MTACFIGEQVIIIWTASYFHIFSQCAAEQWAERYHLRFLVFGVFSIVVISAVLGSISKVWINIYEKYKEKENLEKKLVSLQEDGESLSIDVEKLKDPEYVARYLREKYFYSSDGEYIIRLPQANSGK